MLLRSSLGSAEQRRIKDVVDSTTAVLDYFHDLEVASKFPRADAQKEARALLRKTRFEQGKNYIFINGPEGAVCSPLKPESEGTIMLGKKTADGVLLWDEMTDAINPSLTHGLKTLYKPEGCALKNSQVALHVLFRSEGVLS